MARMGLFAVALSGSIFALVSRNKQESHKLVTSFFKDKIAQWVLFSIRGITEMESLATLGIYGDVLVPQNKKGSRIGSCAQLHTKH